MRDTSSETVDKVPGLADIPIVGGLFKKRSKPATNATKSSFSITPHVIYPGNQPPPSDNAKWPALRFWGNVRHAKNLWEARMGKIIESTLMTLDGVIEDPARWVGDYLDDSFQNNALERLSRTEAMLMGRRTYELLARDWAKEVGDFATAINGIRKFVFSSTLKDATWNNSVVMRGNVPGETAKLKEQHRGDLAIYGHGQLSQTLLKEGLIDEIRLSVFPLLEGSGKLLFREGERVLLRLLEATSLPTGVTVMRYQPA